MTTRRHFLLSSAALGALGPFVLRGQTARAGGAVGQGPKHLVVMFADGGWDVTFAMDPKPRNDVIDGPWVDEPESNPNDVEYRNVFHGIDLQLNDHKRPAVTSFFRVWGDRACVINGIWTGSIVHQPSRIRLFTGTTRQSAADFATIVGVEKGILQDRPLASIDFSGRGYAGTFAAQTGRIGHSAQLKALIEGQTTFPAPADAGYTLPLFVPKDNEEALLQEHLAGRVEAMRGRYGDFDRNHRLLDDMNESYRRRQALLAPSFQEQLTNKLTLGTKPSLGLQADLAVDLLKSGMCHTVTVGEPDGPIWDTHDANHLQHERFELFFTAAFRLMQRLEEEALLQDTLVVLMSEMTRTPRRNFKTGKDHWSHTSMVLLGAGVRADRRVVGASNAQVESQPVDLATGDPSPNGVLNKYDNVAAGLLAHMGVEPGAYFPGVAPFTGATSA